jgi:hypothetical protein
MAIGALVIHDIGYRSLLCGSELRTNAHTPKIHYTLVLVLSHSCSPSLLHEDNKKTKTDRYILALRRTVTVGDRSHAFAILHKITHHMCLYCIVLVPYCTWYSIYKAINASYVAPFRVTIRPVTKNRNQTPKRRNTHNTQYILQVLSTVTPIQ